MSQATVFKERIAQQFSRAAIAYDKAADVQYEIAQETLALISQRTKKMLDIGCGTGRISQQLLAYSEHVLGLDLSPGMIQFAQATYPSNHLSWLNADVENMPLEGSMFDGVFSSMALQWCKPINKALSEIHRVLVPQSEAALSLMCHGSFIELDSAWEEVDQSKRINDFLSHQEIVSVANETGFDVIEKTRSFTTYHDSIIQLLNSIKAIGASTLTTRQSSVNKPLSKTSLLHLENVYRANHEVDGQLPLTYQVSFLKMKKQ
jgi:malonyl-CoA O-methyltransferase